jgi:hypothetical protein
MRSELEGARTNLRRARDTSIAHDELGVANGFHAAENAKNEAVDFALATLNLLDQAYDKLSPTVRDPLLNTIQTKVGQVFREASIKQIIADGVNQQQFPSRRTGEIQATVTEAQNLFAMLVPIQAFLRGLVVEGQLQDPAFQAARRELDDSLAHVRTVVSDVEKGKAALESAAMRRVVEQSSGGFRTLRNQHQTIESRWFTALVIGAVVTAGAVAWAVTTPIDPGSSTTIVAKLLERVLAISAAAVFTRAALVKYNLERNLRIIYDHRATVLDQYQVFENAISEQRPEAKDSLRLEVARVVFSDPRTGYADFGPASEFTVSPVLNLAEHMIKPK